MIRNTPLIFYRQKVLLALLETFGGCLSHTNLQKYLFLFTQEYQKEKSYEFVPYKYGCFSFQSLADLRRLKNMEIIKDNENYSIDSRKNYIDTLNRKDRENLLLFKKKYSSLKGNRLIRKVYLDYPYYAIKSEKAPKLMSEEELKIIELATPDQNEPTFFTIGYEGHCFDNYLNRLIKNNIKVLCDVRKNPISRKYGFSKTTLSKTLENLEIEYISIPELGVVSEKRRSLETKNDYKKLFDEYENTVLKEASHAFEKLTKILKKHKRIAITCFEKDHTMCHRHRIAQALDQTHGWNCKIEHI